jgi:hypothetical protein
MLDSSQKQLRRGRPPLTAEVVEVHIHLRLRRGEDDDLLAFFAQVGKRQRALFLKQALRTGNWNIVIANEPADEDEFARAIEEFVL